MDKKKKGFTDWKKISRFSVCICLLALLFSSCAYGSQQSGIKTIKKENLAELILGDGKLIPGDDLEWNMGKDEFLGSDYGSDAFDPESEKFEEHRVGEMPNGWISYMPFVKVNLMDYHVTADPTYVFDENGSLIAATYGIIFPEGSAESSAEEYKNMLNRLCTEADSMDTLSPQNADLRNFTSEDVLETHLFLRWTDEANGMYFEITSSSFGDTLVMHLRVSVVDLMESEEG